MANICDLKYSDSINEELNEFNRSYQIYKDELSLFYHKILKTHYSEEQKRFYLSLIQNN